MPFREQPIVVALELGTTKTRAVVGEAREDQHLMVLGVGECPSRGIRKSEIIDFDAAVECARDALAAAESNADVGIKQVCLLASGANIRAIVNRGSIPLTEGEVSREDIEHVMETARAVNLQGEYEVLHSICQHFEVDSQRGIINPEGLEGTKLAVDMLILHASRTWLRNLVKVAKTAGVDVQDVAASGLCAALAVLSQEEKQQGAAVIELGGGSTNYVAYAGQMIAAAGAFAVGGDHVTYDLACGLKITLAQAERLKEDYGSAVIDLQRRAQHVELGHEAASRGRYVRLGDLQAITNARAEETLSLVRDELERKNLLPYLGRGIVLTGGGSYLRDILDLAEKVFNLPCRQGRPRDVSGLAVATDGPEYASTIGLLRYALRSSRQSRRGWLQNWFGSIWGGR
ncbi:MAG: cell division protein FtsA [Kiritimatiellae bacterium]|nr:cell division protein FtsA [Kiritimatiellia bacterium]MDW8458609.1 cell division protein FtsA [Verrucomicrobiota bacterium]